MLDGCSGGEGVGRWCWPRGEAELVQGWHGPSGAVVIPPSSAFASCFSGGALSESIKYLIT